MKWDIELPKLQKNVNASRKKQAIDAVFLTPGALVVGHHGGAEVASALPTGLSKEKVQPMSKAKRRMLTKAIHHRKMDPNIKIRTGAAAFKHSKGSYVPYATAEVAEKPYKKALEGKKVRYLRKQQINIPQGANISAAMHELGHLHHYGKPYRHLIASLAKSVGKPIGQIGAVAAMVTEDTAKYVPYVAPAAIYGGTLATEAGANVFAVKEVTRQKGFKAGLKTFKQVAPYMATYLAKPLAVGALLYGLKRKIYG
jgi:hypothetical protein